MLAQVLLEHQVGREPAVGSAALERELLADLGPSHADRPDDIRVGHEHVAEHDLVEVGSAVEERDGVHLDPGRVQIDEHLTQSRVAILGVTRAHEGDHPVVLVRTGRPDLGAVDDPPVVGAVRARHHRREVAPGVGLAHPDAERQLAPADGGEEPLLLVWSTDLGEQRPALAVGDPVVPHRCAEAKQLLGDDEPLDRGTVAAAVLPGQ